MAGIEKGTLYRKTEEMLQEYRAMKARIAILEAELKSIMSAGATETHNEAIEGMYFARAVNDMPRGNEVSNKTARMAAEWRDQYGKDFHRVWRMYVLDKQNKEHEIEIVKGMLNRIDIAISSLLPKEKDVVTLFYIQGMKWEEVGRKLSYDSRHCQRIRERAVWYMTLSLFNRKVYM